MISCERVQSLFGPAWDDELSVAERETLERHFAACTPCQRDYDEFARTLELVQALPRPQVAGDFATRVLAEARRREAEGIPRVGFARGFFARPALAAMAAALFVVAGVSGVMFLRPATGPLVSTHPTLQVAQAPVLTPALTPVLAPPTSLPANERGLMAGDPDGPISTERVASAPTLPARPASRHASPLASEAVAAIPDSLFDHSADVEFVLDPVKLRRERGRGYTPVTSSVRGEQASITF